MSGSRGDWWYLMGAFTSAMWAGITLWNVMGWYRSLSATFAVFAAVYTLSEAAR